MDAYRDQYAQTFKLGRNVVLMAISADPVETQYSWAREQEFPFLMASDSDRHVGRLYGAAAPGRSTDSRYLYVIAPDGRISYRAIPFREIDPTAYKALAAAIDSVTPPPAN